MFHLFALFHSSNHDAYLCTVRLIRAFYSLHFYSNVSYYFLFHFVFLLMLSHSAPPCGLSGAGTHHPGRGGLLRAAPLHYWSEGQRNQEDDGGVWGKVTSGATCRWSRGTHVGNDCAFVWQVNIWVPQPEKQLDLIKVTGLVANVERAKLGLLERVKELQAEQEDRVRNRNATPGSWPEALTHTVQFSTQTRVIHSSLASYKTSPQKGACWASRSKKTRVYNPQVPHSNINQTCCHYVSVTGAFYSFRQVVASSLNMLVSL